MAYSIGQVSKLSGISIYTLRFYANQGLFPYVTKDANGRRVFCDKDLKVLDIVTCLKSTGLSLTEIKEFVDWQVEGDDTLQKRLSIFEKQRLVIIQRIFEEMHNLRELDHKVEYYEIANEAGTEQAALDREDEICRDDHPAFNTLIDEIREHESDFDQPIDANQNHDMTKVTR